MASVTKYRDKWRAHVVVGDARKSKTFKNKADAVFWAKAIEKQIRTEGFVESGMTFNELLDRYARTESPKKRGVDVELRRIRALQRDEMLADLPISTITTELMQEWVENKKQSISKQTGRPMKTSSIARELQLIKAIFTKAVSWKLIPESPTSGVYCKVLEDHRERIASEEEIETLKAVAQWSESEPPVLATQRIVAAFIFACYTGMRIGEIERIERSWIDGNVIRIPREATKTWHSRSVAVPTRAKKILKLVLSLGHTPCVFGLSVGQHDALFRKIRNLAGLGAVYDSNGNEIKQSLNFHDSRATFCTWAASPTEDGAPRLDVLALSRQTGHRNVKMLMKYYRKDASEFLNRLNAK